MPSKSRQRKARVADRVLQVFSQPWQLREHRLHLRKRHTRDNTLRNS